MLSSSYKSDSFKGQSLDNDSFTTNFDHAAAGHDGLRCHLSGSLIAKPCTHGEVAFYESSIRHPNFHAFMPQWYGTLTASDQQQPLSVVPGVQNGRTVLPSLATHSSTNGFTVTNQVSAHHHHHHVTQREKPWTPSGGRKLDTGISIVLENIAEGFKRPNVLDVKLGSRLWADDAPPAKRAKLDAVSRETTSSSLGYRIAGMKVWVGNRNENGSAIESMETEFTDPYMTKYEGSEAPKGEVVEKNGYKRYDKWYGRAFTADNVKEGFETFLAGAKAGKVDRSKLIASRLVQELRALKFALESEESRMYSSSVLVIYEGDPDALEEALKYEETRKLEETRSSSESDAGTEPLDDIAGEFDITELGSLQTMGIPNGISNGIANGVVNGGANGGLNNATNNTEARNIPGALNIQIDPQSLANMEDDGSSDEEEVPIKVHDFRLIDFAHASWTPGQGPDENTLKGIRNLIKVMEELAGESES
ncbi:arginine metabolism regulation protein iii [Talaromyces stipitatus ATCC 10500]|uniref:Kinase n=1 Tax=Talaromyces stipitatus (strain ATCC 10500 / CBS 375.48 / QM 6759 / NRRL 1006) TaxID=441959 RepID=B8LTG5_TALSN|nr:arginine metabolism regulation protein iii [Talaromyces stipitatus ATCC 10500]EED23043.1 arginine metabolism regulation protein iii [Talaromyces stipitatus ATCC 10500]